MKYVGGLPRQLPPADAHGHRQAPGAATPPILWAVSAGSACACLEGRQRLLEASFTPAAFEL
jgi:hypothetical protein